MNRITYIRNSFTEIKMFYLTMASVQLHTVLRDTGRRRSFEKTEKAIFDLCQKIDKYAHNLELEDLKTDEYCSLIPDLSLKTVRNVIESTKNKIEKGRISENNQIFLHTGPHHDDIMLGIFPCIVPQLRFTQQIPFCSSDIRFYSQP